MTINKFNAPGGLSTGTTPIDVVQPDGSVTANNLSVNSTATFSGISGVIIPGGSAGQFIQTDGAGQQVPVIQDSRVLRATDMRQLLLQVSRWAHPAQNQLQ